MSCSCEVGAAGRKPPEAMALRDSADQSDVKGRTMNDIDSNERRATEMEADDVDARRVDRDIDEKDGPPNEAAGAGAGALGGAAVGAVVGGPVGAVVGGVVGAAGGAAVGDATKHDDDEAGSTAGGGAGAV